VDHLAAATLSLAVAAVCLQAAGAQTPPPPPARVAEVDGEGRLLVRGVPTFLHGWYSDGDPGRLERLAAAGFDAVLDYGLTARPLAATRRYLDRAQALGIHVIGCLNDVYPSARYRTSLGSWEGNAAILEGVITALRDHPAIIAWYNNDELPEALAPEIRAYSSRIRELDPSRPQLLVHDRPEALPAFLDTAELFGIDRYPIPMHRPGAVVTALRQSRDAVGARPLFAVLQDFAWYQHHPVQEPRWGDPLASDRARLPTAEEWEQGRPPSEAETRAMLHLALVEGAGGVLWWSLYNLEFLPDRAERWAAATRLAAEVRSIAPALTGATVPVPVQGTGILAAIRCTEATAVLIVVNASDEPRRATLELPAGFVGPREIEVLFEDRRVPAEEGRIRDFFAPLARHVYRLR
jgi:hypothetical protein